MQAHDQFHVLADHVGAEAAGGDHRLAVEYAEGARDDQEPVDRAPAKASAEECAQVLDHLHERERILRQPDLLDHAAAHLAAIDDAYRAAAGDRARVLEERPHDVLEAAHLQHRVRVAAIEDRVARGVQAGIGGIRLAAVLLVDDAQVRILERAVDAPHGLRLDLDAIGLGETA